MAPGQPPFPELVFVPARPEASGGGREVAYEVRTLADGTVALPAFSTVARLVAALGHYQPWACVSLRTVQAAMGKAGVPTVVVDPAVDPSAWRWQERSLRAFTEGEVGSELGGSIGRSAEPVGAGAVHL